MPSTEEEQEKHNAVVDDEDIEDDEDESDDEDDGEEDLESDDEIDEDDDHHDPNQQEPFHHRPPPAAPTTTTTTHILPRPPPDSPPDRKRQPTTTTIPTPLQPSSLPPEEKKPTPIDDSRKLFQRLWTDEDEIGLLQGFLEYTSQRGGFKNSAYHHDTAPFYDQIKSRLQLDFNKSQLVEKLRRLKKKYRNAMSRINSGKDLSFKTSHDQATFDISRKIWSDIGGVEDEDHATPIGSDANPSQVPPPSLASSSRKRSRTTTTPTPAVGVEENVLDPSLNSSLHNMIEETVSSYLPPLFKELMHSAINGPTFGGLGLNPLRMNFLGGAGEREMMDEKWRKQRILELEVYSQRAELVQDQIKLALEELRSNGCR